MSLSASPAFLPCGIPEALEPALELEVEEAAAGGEEALEVLDEDEPPPPQPATARATRARANPNHLRAVVELMFMVIPLFSTGTAATAGSFPSAAHR